jgi:hypothetical protein
MIRCQVPLATLPPNGKKSCCISIGTDIEVRTGKGCSRMNPLTVVPLSLAFSGMSIHSRRGDRTAKHMVESISKSKFPRQASFGTMLSHSLDSPFSLSYLRLSQAITERWRRLSDEGRAFYRRVAQADHAQYDRFRAPQMRQRKFSPLHCTSASSSHHNGTAV